MIAENATLIMMAVAFVDGLAVGAMIVYSIYRKKSNATDYDFELCDRCTWIGRRRDLIDGEACPKCRLVVARGRA